MSNKTTEGITARRTRFARVLRALSASGMKEPDGSRGADFGEKLKKKLDKQKIL